MSLGKLLTTGKSLVGLHNSNARYQLRKGALPKFESAKNPFVSRAHVEVPSPVAEREPQLPKLTPAEIAAANLKKTQRLPVFDAQGEVVSEVSQPAEPAKVPAVVDSWLKRINPMVWWENRKPAAAKPAVQRFNKVPVQGELSLDNIKVMRNDLSETDMEVVSAKPRAAAVPSSGKASAGAMAAPELPSAKKALDFLNERLLGKH